MIKAGTKLDRFFFFISINVLVLDIQGGGAGTEGLDHVTKTEFSV